MVSGCLRQLCLRILPSSQTLYASSRGSIVVSSPSSLPSSFSLSIVTSFRFSAIVKFIGETPMSCNFKVILVIWIWRSLCLFAGEFHLISKLPV